MTDNHGRREVAFRKRGDKGRGASGTFLSRGTGQSSTSPNSSRQISRPPVFFVALVVLALAKAAMMRHYALATNNLLTTALVESAFIVLVLGIADLIPRRRSYWLDLVAYSLLSVLMLVSTIYVAFYTQLFDPHMLSVAGQLGTVADVIGQLIKPVYALFLIDIPLLAVWAFMLSKSARAQEQRSATDSALGIPSRSAAAVPQGRSKRIAVLTAVAAAVFVGQLFFALQIDSWVDGVAVAKARGLSVAQAVVFFPRASDDAADSAIADEVDAPATTVAGSKPATVPATPGGKMMARIERIRGADQGSRIATFAPGAFKGKNIIVIQVEALNTMVMQKNIDGQEITPNLNALIKESWYFPNTYSETGMGNTADAEFVVNSSMYTPRGQAAPVTYADREIPALPRLVRALGYDAFALHQNKAAYWNRKELYPALGFTHYYDAPFYHWDDMMGPMGPSDEKLFSKGMDVLRQMDASSTPYYAQFVTLSAHTPFENTPESRRPVKTPADLKGSLMGKYISAESYSDFAIGKFIADLKKAKIWDKSVIIIYGDHTALLDNQLTGTDDKAAQQLLGRAYGPADRQRVPLIIHLPKQTTPQLVEKTAGQVDIMPTAADLLGIDITAVPHMGRSLFVNSAALVPLRSYLPGGTFVNDNAIFMPGLGFDDGTAQKVADSSSVKSTDQEKSDFKRVIELTKISDKWIRSLPKRKDAGDLKDAWIPAADARKAAAPYGAQQGGYE
jgi:lipoteichoic acid synthase